MKLFKVSEFAALLRDLQDTESKCRELRQLGADIHNPKPDEHVLDAAIRRLEDAERLCVEGGLNTANVKIFQINNHLDYRRQQIDYSSLEPELRNARESILANLHERRFAAISPEYGDYVNNEDLCGQEVKSAFKSAIPDIREAGNCIAIESGTAAVFHLMRAVERGLRALCRDLGIRGVPRKKKYVPIEYAVWETMFQQLHGKVDKKIDALPAGPKKQKLQEFYYPLLQDLRGFKDAFRNHVMHDRKIYSAKAADDLLDYVRRFMSLLATKISERGDKKKRSV
ncbi:MAG: hypothetical protein ACLQJF_05875 [Candidatus Sulfotelmatobacter sp.]|jgi:hypothetical protein